VELLRLHDVNHVVEDPQRSDQQMQSVRQKRRLPLLIDAVANELENPAENEERHIDPERQQSADEVEVLFTLMAERYERRPMIITSNLVFGEWERIFKNPMTTATITPMMAITVYWRFR